ncbi:hypothetical protein HD806DRAFT_497675 [Xylariaceae sp. AK1471]|nr:hypothetical protein HD806DRAFT_497675 [Xylariaceae sp. AK1471]
MAWLRAQLHTVKIVVGGNHDLLLDSSHPDPDRLHLEARQQLDWGDIKYLRDNATTANFKNGRAMNVYGSLSSSILTR